MLALIQRDLQLWREGPFRAGPAVELACCDELEQQRPAAAPRPFFRGPAVQPVAEPDRSALVRGGIVNHRLGLSAAVLVFAVLGVARAAPPPALAPVEGRIVWVDFWASWCVPCRRSFPWLNTMQRKYGPDGLQIIAVNLDKDRALADGFLAEVPAEFSLRFDPAGAVAKDFGVQTMPSSFLIDADGNVLARHVGFRSSDSADYEDSIKAALDKVGVAR
jgi:cytochrome c biogenesis protein CcmG, thiol:disulfide interchange protein DsbE